MALRFSVENLDGIPAPLREHYVAKDGKFCLVLSDGHPDTAKLNEFRETNVSLLKEVEQLRPLKTKFEGIDPDEVKADRLKLEELLKVTPDDRVVKLEAELAAAEERANQAKVRDWMRLRAIAAGVLPEATDILLDKAAPFFTWGNEGVQARPNTFSSAYPGEPLTPEEWMTAATKDMPFLFGHSAGGGAAGSKGDPVRFGNKELRDPTPQQLGQYARQIASGELRIVNTGD